MILTVLICGSPDLTALNMFPRFSMLDSINVRAIRHETVSNNPVTESSFQQCSDLSNLCSGENRRRDSFLDRTINHVVFACTGEQVSGIYAGSNVTAMQYPKLGLSIDKLVGKTISAIKASVKPEHSIAFAFTAYPYPAIFPWSMSWSFINLIPEAFKIFFGWFWKWFHTLEK